jgi:mitogen-activated protein kinase 1/3
LDLQKPNSINEFKDVYIITELMETDLNQIIKSKNTISDEHIQYFIYQIMCALAYIHSADVLHVDLLLAYSFSVI